MKKNLSNLTEDQLRDYGPHGSAFPSHASFLAWIHKSYGNEGLELIADMIRQGLSEAEDQARADELKAAERRAADDPHNAAVYQKGADTTRSYACKYIKVDIEELSRLGLSTLANVLVGILDEHAQGHG
jgi:hypothetical protein